MSVHLSHMQRLVALMRQAQRDVRNLATIQRRVTALLLTCGELALTEDTLDTYEAMLKQAAQSITVMEDALLSAREAADSEEGTMYEGDCTQ